MFHDRMTEQCVSSTYVDSVVKACGHHAEGNTVVFLYSSASLMFCKALQMATRWYSVCTTY